MQFDTPQDIRRLANIIDAEIIGEADKSIQGLNELSKVRIGDITYLDKNEEDIEPYLSSDASAIILSKKMDCPEGKTLLICRDPLEAFNYIIQEQEYYYPMASSIHRSVKLGEDTLLEIGVVVGENVTIGENCIIHANVVIYKNVTIGNNVTIHANSVIGSNAFHYTKDNETKEYKKLVTCGEVHIKDNVEIGANSTIESGVTDITTIAEGVKIGNQVQIGNSATINKNCILYPKTIIESYKVIEENTTIR